MNRRERRKLGIRPIDVAGIAQGYRPRMVVRRGVMTPEERASYVEREATRRGLNDEQRKAWIAAGGHTGWLHTPEWSDADEDDDDG